MSSSLSPPPTSLAPWGCLVLSLILHLLPLVPHHYPLPTHSHSLALPFTPEGQRQAWS